MSADRPETVILRGAFARHQNVAATLNAAGYQVVTDPAGDAAMRAVAGSGVDLVLCDADSFAVERLIAIVRASASAGARVLVVSSAADQTDISAWFRAGASDWIVHAGGDDLDHLLRRLEALRQGNAAPAPPQTTELQRLVAKLAHDVKNPIGNILGYIDILREGTDSPLDRDQSDLLLRIEQNCTRALELLARFADAASRLR